MLHAAVAVIVIGATVTFLYGRYGRMHLLQGAETNEFVCGDRQTDFLPFTVVLDSFRVEYYPSMPSTLRTADKQPSDYLAWLTIDGKRKACVAINKPLTVGGYSLQLMDYDADYQRVKMGVNHDPWGRAVVYIGYIIFLLSLLLLVVQRLFHYPRLASALIVTVAVIVLLVHRSWSSPHLLPVLNSHWLLAHVSTIMTSYLLFVLLAVSSLLAYLRRGLSAAIEHLLLLVAVTLLATGIALGSVWADESWGRYWSWDPKETWALITLVIYALPLHTSILPYLRRPSLRRIYMLVALLAVLMTYFGVNWFIGGMHGYN